jgi:hypothetical protein
MMRRLSFTTMIGQLPNLLLRNFRVVISEKASESNCRSWEDLEIETKRVQSGGVLINTRDYHFP